MSRRRMAAAVALVQGVIAGRVFWCMVRTANGRRIRRVDEESSPKNTVTVLIPVLNEALRLAPCLEGAIAQGPEVAEILVIDGGSVDGTRPLVQRFTERDARVRLIDATPIPIGVNGKSHGLQAGYLHSETNGDSVTPWLLTLDADVRPHPSLVRSLLVHADREDLAAFSVATKQRLSGAAEGMLHPAMLTTLVYRFGIPGHATTHVDQVQANGQCFFADRLSLQAIGGFDGAIHSINEDVTVARALVAAGYRVGFYESDDLVSVEMYAGWREAWQNWTRSLPMRDQFSRYWSDLGLAEILLVQALPPWIAVFALRALGRRHPLTVLNLALTIARIGVLQGTARAYLHRPWTYWLSPASDLPVVLRMMVMSRRTHHLWRGRMIVAGDSG